MKKYYLLILIVSIIFAGDPARTTRYESNLLLWPQGMDIESYHAIGFSDITQNQVSDICDANPASLTNFTSISMGFGYEYSTEMKKIIVNDISARKQINWYPNKFSIVVPIKNFAIGLAYHQKYKLRISLGDLEVTTVENMDGTGVMTEYYFKNKITSYSGLVAYKFSDVIRNNDEFSLGFQYFIDTYEEYYKWPYELSNDDFKNTYTWKIGTRYSLNNFSIGLLYEKGFYIRDKIKNNFDIEYTNLYLYPSHFVGQLPDKLALGCRYPINEKLTFSSTITQVFWNVIDGYKNSLVYSVNGIYELSQGRKVSLGIYNAQRYFDFSGFNDEYSYTNINLGLKVPYKTFEFVVKLSDSHLFSSDGMKYTAAQFGLDYRLK